MAGLSCRLVRLAISPPVKQFISGVDTIFSVMTSQWLKLKNHK